VTGRGLAWLCVLGLAGACRSDDSEGTWSKAEVPAATDRILKQVTLLAFDKVGFPPSAQLAESDLITTSGWKASLAPFKGDGYREQAVVRYTRLSTGHYAVEVRVKRERNDNLRNPLDPGQAVWKPEADDQETAAVLLQHIRSMMGEELEVGPRASDRFRTP
jgi:hypothetical protein